jgi:nucleoside-diphosphate-sugar epimerase
VAKAFLTGGAGFVGSHVSRILLEQGHEVAIFDQFVNYIYPLDHVHVDNLTQRMSRIKDHVTPRPRSAVRIPTASRLACGLTTFD